jgi:hypothetical protein
MKMSHKMGTMCKSSFRKRRFSASLSKLVSSTQPSSFAIDDFSRWICSALLDSGWWVDDIFDNILSVIVFANVGSMCFNVKIQKYGCNIRRLRDRTGRVGLGLDGYLVECLPPRGPQIITSEAFPCRIRQCHIFRRDARCGRREVTA